MPSGWTAEVGSEASGGREPPVATPELGGVSPQLAARTALAWLAPLLTAGLLYLCFFPVAIGWLAWGAMVPWLCLVRLGRPRRLYLAAYLGALAFYLPALQWARVADPRMYVTWIILAVYVSVYTPLALALLRRLDRKTSLPLVVTFPIVWVFVEYLRWGMWGSFLSLITGSHQHNVPGGFSWYFLGHSQHDLLEVIQIADLGGVYAVSFVVACVNGLLFEILYSREGFRRWLHGGEAPSRHGKTALLGQSLGVAGLLFATLAYGQVRLSENALTPGPRLALMQTNVDQRLRNRAYDAEADQRQEARKRVAVDFATLASLAADQRPDLIVSPETSYPGFWEEVAHGQPGHYSRQQAQRISGALHTPILLGMNSAVGGEERGIKSHNSAILIDAEGKWQGRYDKIHRVPFGEYVPLHSWLPFLNRLAPYDFDYSVAPGEEFVRFPLRGEKREYTFGVVICYEDTDPTMARPYARGEKVDFLLNVSNDGWFNGTSEHDQHLAICRFRAIETRRAIGRSVNMGISAIVDSNGGLLAPTLVREKEGISLWEIPDNAAGLPVARWHEFKQVAGVLVGRMPVDARRSVYAEWGDAFAMGCGAMVVVGLCFARGRRNPA